MALVELFARRRARYLELAKFFIDQRGRQMRVWDGLDRISPGSRSLREATRSKGTPYARCTDGRATICISNREQALLTLVALVEDMITGKMHITGGVGARYEGESSRSV